MGRYIDADTVKINYIGGFNDTFEIDYDSFMNAPSIDIVRCKECKHWTKWGDGEMFCGCLEGGIGSDADDYCSYGERRE